MNRRGFLGLLFGGAVVGVAAPALTEKRARGVTFEPRNDRPYERIVCVSGIGDDTTVERVIDIGPAVEDGRVWMWEGDKVVAGPFKSKDAGFSWFRASQRCDSDSRIVDVRTRAYTWEPRKKRAMKLGRW